MLKQICFHIARCERSSCKDSYRTLHKIGYIITSRPTAVQTLVSAPLDQNPELSSPMRWEIPIGTDTPTNLPRCSAGPAFGTKFPKMIPTTMAKNIHSARNRSRMPSPLNADSSCPCLCGRLVLIAAPSRSAWSLLPCVVSACGETEDSCGDAGSSLVSESILKVRSWLFLGASNGVKEVVFRC